MIYGYARISRKEQSIDRQIHNILTAYPTARIYQEAYTGTKIDGRAELTKLLKRVKCGDTIAFDSVSRMSRCAADGWSLYQNLFDRGVELVFLKEPQVNTATYRDELSRTVSTITTGDADADELVNSITAAITKYMMRLAERQIKTCFEQAQKEVDDLHQRTAEGIAAVKRANIEALAEGRTEDVKQIGAVKGSTLHTRTGDRIKEAIREYSKDFNGTLSDADVMKLIRGTGESCARNTYYKYKSELKQSELT